MSASNATGCGTAKNRFLHGAGRAAIIRRTARCFREPRHRLEADAGLMANPSGDRILN